jgi:hypothetical protein
LHKEPEARTTKNKTNLKKFKKKKQKQKEARPWIYRRRCEIYKVVKVEREGRLL